MKEYQEGSAHKAINAGDAKTAALRCVTALLLWQGISAAASVLLGSVPSFKNTRSYSCLVTGASSAALIPLFLILADRWRITDRGRRIKGRAGRSLFLAAASLSGIGLSLLYGRITEILKLTEHFSNQIQEELYSAPFPLALAVLAVLAPISEELLFRGLIFGSLRRTMPEAAAAVAACALFALLHGNMVQIIYAFPMALAMQLFYRLEGGLEAPLVFHMSANLISVLTEYILH